MVVSVPRDLNKQPAMFCSKPWHCRYLDTVFDQWKVLWVPLFLSLVMAQSMSVT